MLTKGCECFLLIIIIALFIATPFSYLFSIKLLTLVLVCSHYGSSALTDLNRCHGTLCVVKLPLCIFKKAVSDPEQNSNSGKDNRWQDKRRQIVFGSRGCLGILWQTSDFDTSLPWMEKSGKLSDFALFRGKKIPSDLEPSHFLALSGMVLTNRQRRPDLKQGAVWSSVHHFHSVKIEQSKNQFILKMIFGIERVKISSVLQMHYRSINVTKSIRYKRRRNCAKFQRGCNAHHGEVWH